MQARVTKGEGRGIEPEGEEPPPLVGESEVLYRTVYSKGPHGSCVQMKPVRAEFEEAPYGIEFKRTVR